MLSKSNTDVKAVVDSSTQPPEVDNTAKSSKRKDVFKSPEKKAEKSEERRKSRSKPKESKSRSRSSHSTSSSSYSSYSSSSDWYVRIEHYTATDSNLIQKWNKQYNKQ